MLTSGWIAVIPQRGLRVNKWFGYGWQIIDPNSGAAGYLLAGYLTSSSAIMAGGSGTISFRDNFGDFLFKLYKTAEIFGWMSLGTFVGLTMVMATLCIEAGLLGAILGAGLGVIGCVLAAAAIVFGLYAIYNLWFGAITQRRRWLALRKLSLSLC